VVSGPTVAFQVAEPNKRKFPWWIVIVAVVAVLLLAGGGILIWNLTRPAPTPTPTKTEAARPVFTTGNFVFDQPTQDVDLDGDGIIDVSLSDADLIAVPDNRPTTVTGAMRGVAFTTDPSFVACRDATFSPSVDIPDAQGTTWVCTFTSREHVAVLEFAPQNGSQARDVSYTVWQ
ncbi:hypothetical protein, partial [Microbacterium deminutum]|uniref:hypothetical protein n=1 Tax=Microbacterium deminutum TaxID=344164 RepID=UPI0031DBA609